MPIAEANNSASNTSYPAMILAAIAALGEKDGSNKSEIINYIEATYADTLREGYTAEISETLTKLKESGELLFANNHYSKPDLNLPPRRGRGRPKMAKPTLPLGALPPTPRPRGRPPQPKGSQSNSVKAVGVPLRRGRPSKPKDSNAAAVKAAGGIPRRRGRPPMPKDSNGAAVKAAGGIPRRRGRPPMPKDSNGAAVKAAGGIPRRRGRPPMPKDSNGAAVKAPGGISRRRGRPPKKHRPVVPAAFKAVAKVDGTAPAISGVKRGRGRPPKVKLAVADAAAE